MDWTTPTDLRAHVEKYWARGRILAAALQDDSLFPLPLRLRRPNTRDLAERFDDVRRWIRDLDAASKQRLGHGYEIQWEERVLRQLGRNEVPKAVSVPTRQDALQLIRKQRLAQRFDELAAATLRAFPSLHAWLVKRPLKLIDHADDWERVLDTLMWFREHPRPGLYLRQLDIAGVDTKFIESRRALLAELLEQILPTDPSDETAATPAASSFELRYGLLPKPALVRFRILDEQFRIGGLSDIATPASQFAALNLPVEHVFITENETNGLAFPLLPNSIVIFGLGYGLERLGEVAWLSDKTLHYWGDLDTHGFAILDRVRAAFPNARSLLMDRETLLAHRDLWVIEQTPYRGPPLTRLTASEQALFDDLANNRIGSQVRLEQERISFARLQSALDSIVGRGYA